MNPYRESRYRARKKYYSKEENIQKKRDYMREYRKRPYVKAKSHEYYLKRIIKQNENDNLNSQNTVRFLNG